MIYKFLRVLVTILLKVYFRKIYISGVDNLPEDGPVLITANHPDGFTEPLLLACFLKRPLHFLVRGDVFENPILEPLLRATNQIPIFRSKDGFSNLRNNGKSLEEVIRLLSEEIALLVFAEGSTKLVKRIRPIQKGTAKIAAQALEQYPGLPIKMVPISLYYPEQVTFRSEVIIHIGKSIPVADYLQESDGNLANKLNSLTKTVEARMKEMMPTLEDEMIRVSETLAPLAYQDYEYRVFPLVEKSKTRGAAEKKLIKKIEAGIIKALPTRRIFYFNFWSLFLLMPATIGLVFNGIPLIVTYYGASKLASSMVFLNAIRIVVGLVVFTLYYISLIFLGAFLGLSWYGPLLLAIIAGILLLIYESYNYKSYLSKLTSN